MTRDYSGDVTRPSLWPAEAHVAAAPGAADENDDARRSPAQEPTNVIEDVQEQFHGSESRSARPSARPMTPSGPTFTGWGYTKIRDALRGLKVEIGRTTVAGLLLQAGIEPAPERIRKRTWKHFLKSHWETLHACDFFSVEVLGVFGTVRHMVFFVMEVKSRAVQIAGIQVAPD